MQAAERNDDESDDDGAAISDRTEEITWDVSTDFRYRKRGGRHSVSQMTSYFRSWFPFHEISTIECSPTAFRYIYEARLVCHPAVS